MDGAAIPPRPAPSPAAPAVVLDTNVWLDLFVFDDPPARPLAAALECGRLLAVRSEATCAELRVVLARPSFAAAPVQQLLQRWQELAQPFAAPAAAPCRCTDPHDQKFLDLAYAARARLLLTRDRALLALAARARRDGLAILAPRSLDRFLAEHGAP
ncbi:MAG TPA: putative toxin-antitoxin system toxin component, PIN family [Burkholderiaceae bacterium]